MKDSQSGGPEAYTDESQRLSRSRIIQLLETIRENRSYSFQELKLIYRILSKSTHPDLHNQDGELFIRVQEVYEQALQRFRQQQSSTAVYGTAASPHTVPGHRLLKELGYQFSISPGMKFHILSQQYFQKAVYRKKVYANQAMHQRNYRIIQGMEFWAGEYEPEFVEIFQNFRSSLNRILPLTQDTQKYIHSMRILMKGIIACSWYHEQGAVRYLSMAEDRLRGGISLCEPLGRSISAAPVLCRLGYFYLRELEKPPLEFQSRQGYWENFRIL
ncbi:hypothetical protein [Salinispira pacifica]|uniref:J domain-containing protein n=1 Tax=Salinispira pacifica TaxID=1307761 RepID=V5WHP3_9SPIO|nr:hypothetical protein [Salinispira pacifica]AHC14691.1 hypothetical protein L21SP2_1290 [Salinispira pacifica]